MTHSCFSEEEWDRGDQIYDDRKERGLVPRISDGGMGSGSMRDRWIFAVKELGIPPVILDSMPLCPKCGQRRSPMAAITPHQFDVMCTNPGCDQYQKIETVGM